MAKKEIDLTTVGGRLRAKRNEVGFTQEQLAERVMVKGNQICQYEKNQINIPLNTLQRLAKELDTSVSYLADGVEADLTEEEAELLAVFNSIGSAALKKVALEQIKLLAGIKER